MFTHTVFCTLAEIRAKVFAGGRVSNTIQDGGVTEKSAQLWEVRSTHARFRAKSRPRYNPRRRNWTVWEIPAADFLIVRAFCDLRRMECR